MKSPGKKVAILGLGISGFQSALFLKEKGFEVFVSDQGQGDLLRERVRLLQEKGIETECGKHSNERILLSDWVLISPGISPASLVYQSVRSKGIPIYSEIEVASWYSPSSRIIGVTGTCGKTTVTTLISRVLQKAGYGVVTCGNIGNPWIGEIEKIQKDDFIVLELSSFQLEHCFSFRPQVGILLNLSPNHEDWHHDMAEYAASKLRLFQKQTSEDYAIIRQKDRQSIFPEFSFHSKVLYLDQNEKTNPNEEVLRIVGQIFNCPSGAIQEVLSEFEGLEHRLENVLTAEGVKYINDSKSTTVSSLLWALSKFGDKEVILLAGGHPKTRDFETAREMIQRKVKLAILIGEARPLLREAWHGACPFFETDDFRQAVEKAHESAAKGDVVILSPACASFDMFKNYQERGTLYKKLVKEVASPVGFKHV
jgi:UDP-N-acetylmuramoylalanine--D-glutamate ligase